MPRRGTAVLASGLLLATLLTTALLEACGGVAEPSFEKVSADVVEALRAGVQPDVFVSLEPPSGYGEPDADLEAMKREIAESRDRVLADLDPGDYRNRIRFDAIPALAGTVLTQHGLTSLEDHPLVTAVSLDEGGTGS